MLSFCVYLTLEITMMAWEEVEQNGQITSGGIVEMYEVCFVLSVQEAFRKGHSLHQDISRLFFPFLVVLCCLVEDI